MGVHNEIMKVDVATKQVRQLTKGEHNLIGWSFNEDAGVHLFLRNTDRAAQRSVHDARLPAAS